MRIPLKHYLQDGDVQGSPMEMLSILDKKYLFKVDIKRAPSSSVYDQSFRVKRVCMDPNVIDMFEASSLGTQVSSYSSFCLWLI